MTFANVSISQEQITLLSQLLLSAFPGCVIHQSRDLMRAITHLSTQKVDAVFADADMYPNLIHQLNRQKSKTSVYLISQQELVPPEKTDGIRGVITYPITKQKIQVVMQTIPQKVREVV